MEFSWSRLGDVKLGRANLGSLMPVELYRLMQYTINDELTERFGKEAAQAALRGAGYRAGIAFSRNVLERHTDFGQFAAQLQQKLRENSIGVLRLEKADLENLSFVMTISEDLDCSGLPVTGDSICVYDEGFLAAILYDFFGKEFTVVEVDCWATGDRTCRFTADVTK